MPKLDHSSKYLILYSTFAGFISAWAISGLLVIVDIVSQTPIGTFFAVIGTSLGFYDPAVSQYIGFALHIATGTVAGNIFGQVALFWNKLFPSNLKRGITYGIIAGVSLWVVLFLPPSHIYNSTQIRCFCCICSKPISIWNSRSLSRALSTCSYRFFRISHNIRYYIWIHSMEDGRIKKRCTNQ